MKTFYQVRIDDKTRADFINACDWGTQGPVVEALFRAFLLRSLMDSPSLAVAKVLRGDYVFYDQTKEQDDA